MVSVWAPGAVALVDYSDDFEDDVSGLAPTSNFYTHSQSGSGNFRVTDALANSAPNSYQIIAPDATVISSTFLFTQSISICSIEANTAFEYFFRVSNLGTTTDAGFKLTNSGGTEFVMVRVATATTVTVVVDTAGAAEATADTWTVSTNTWYRARFVFTNCAANQIAIYLFSQAGSELDFTSFDGADALTDLDRLTISTSTNRFGQINFDDLSLENVNDPVVAVSADATSDTFTSIVGFDVDKLGTTVIIAHDSSDDVATLSGTSLVTLATEDRDCVGTDRVMSQFMNGNSLVGFVDCDVATSPDFFKIRTPNLGEPSDEQLSGCGASCATFDIDAFSSDGSNGQQEISEIASFPIDFSTQESCGAGGCARFRLAWGWSSSASGNIGINAYSDNQGALGVDNSWVSRAVALSGSPADDICTGMDAGTPYLAGADASVGARVYPLSFFNSSATVLDVSIGTPAAPGVVTTAKAVACAGPNVAIMSGTQVAVVDRETGNVVNAAYPLTISAGADRGVALSEPDSLGRFWLAYQDSGTTITIANGTTGATVGTITISGTTRGIELTKFANNLFRCSGTVCNRYGLASQIDAIPSQSEATGGAITPPVSSDGLFGGAGATVGDALGTGAFGGNLFLGSVLIGLVAYGAGTGYGNTFDSNATGSRALRVNPWAAALGAILGFLMAWGFGFFSTAVVFAVVVLACLVIGVKFWMGRA